MKHFIIIFFSGLLWIVNIVGIICEMTDLQDVGQYLQVYKKLMSLGKGQSSDFCPWHDLWPLPLARPLTNPFGMTSVLGKASNLCPWHDLGPLSLARPLTYPLGMTSEVCPCMTYGPLSLARPLTYVLAMTSHANTWFDLFTEELLTLLLYSSAFRCRYFRKCHTTATQVTLNHIKRWTWSLSSTHPTVN